MATFPLWWFDDGKAGHQRQVRALLQALDERIGVAPTRLEPWRAARQAKAWLGRRQQAGPAPRLLIGAGHDTHFSLLAARRLTGAPTVVLMRPSLPGACFDLCVIPEHDAPRPADNVMITRGPLSPLKPAAQRGNKALILTGGPSRHYLWDSDFVWIQIRDLVLTQTDVRWELTTSRRTPADFLNKAPHAVGDLLKMHRFDNLPDDWLDQHLPTAACSVLTPDSASMVFDSLSCGVPSALLQLKPQANSRIAKIMDKLAAQREVGQVAAWLAGTPLPATPPLREADRVAGAIAERWFQ